METMCEIDRVGFGEAGSSITRDAAPRIAGWRTTGRGRHVSSQWGDDLAEAGKRKTGAVMSRVRRSGDGKTGLAAGKRRIEPARQTGDCIGTDPPHRCPGRAISSSARNLVMSLSRWNVQVNRVRRTGPSGEGRPSSVLRLDYSRVVFVGGALPFSAWFRLLSCFLLLGFGNGGPHCLRINLVEAGGFRERIVVLVYSRTSDGADEHSLENKHSECSASAFL